MCRINVNIILHYGVSAPSRNYVGTKSMIHMLTKTSTCSVDDNINQNDRTTICFICHSIFISAISESHSLASCSRNSFREPCSCWLIAAFDHLIFKLISIFFQILAKCFRPINTLCWHQILFQLPETALYKSVFSYFR